MDAEVTCGSGGVVGAAWGAAKVMGAVRGTTEVSEVDDEGVTRGRTVGPPASVPRVVGPPGSAVRPLAVGTPREREVLEVVQA
jgi:hypothetical protein